MIDKTEEKLTRGEKMKLDAWKQQLKINQLRVRLQIGQLILMTSSLAISFTTLMVVLHKW